MNTVLQATAIVLLSMIASLTLRQQGKDFSLLLSILVCCIISAVAIGCLKPVIALIQHLMEIGSLNTEMFSILCKVVGIGIVTEIAGMVCADAGNAAMGKALQYVSLAVILRLSVPMLYALLDTLEELLEVL